MTGKDIKDTKFTAYYPRFIGKETYHLLKDQAFPEEPISLSYESFKELLFRHVQSALNAERAKSHKTK